jgi:hypothetical protein
MNNILSFMVGTISGVYIAQNYNVPNVKKLGGKIILYIKSLEK